MSFHTCFYCNKTWSCPVANRACQCDIINEPVEELNATKVYEFCSRACYESWELETFSLTRIELIYRHRPIIPVPL